MPATTSAVSAGRLFIVFTLLLITDSKGIAANMMKISSKRRRTQTQIAADKAAKQQQEEEMAAKMAQFNDLQR